MTPGSPNTLIVEGYGVADARSLIVIAPPLAYSTLSGLRVAGGSSLSKTIVAVRAIETGAIPVRKRPSGD